MFISAMNISLPESMKSFVDQQVKALGFGTSSKHVRKLIRKDQDIQRLRALLLDGASSPAGKPVDAVYFEDHAVTSAFARRHDRRTFSPACAGSR